MFAIIRMLKLYLEGTSIFLSNLYLVSIYQSLSVMPYLPAEEIMCSGVSCRDLQARGMMLDVSLVGKDDSFRICELFAQKTREKALIVVSTESCGTLSHNTKPGDRHKN